MKQCCKEYMLGQFGDEEVVAEIYGEYKASLASKIAECEEAMASGDWVKLDRAAHAIKGNSLAVGDNEVAEKAITRRSTAKLQEVEGSRALVDAIKELSTQL